MKKALKQGLWALELVLAAGAIFLIIILFIVPVCTGSQTFIIATGSMEPTLRVGDIAVVKPMEGLPKVGQVITIAVSDKVLLTHRVVRIDENEGLVYARGDANLTEDLAPYGLDKVVGIVWYSIPWVGKAALWLKGA